jgi:hypothetical protein
MERSILFGPSPGWKQDEVVSRDKSDKDKVRKVLTKLFTWTMIVEVLLGVVLLIVGWFLPRDHLWRDIVTEMAMILFGVVIASLVHERALGDYYQQQAQDIVNETVSPGLDRLEGRIVEGIREVIPVLRAETLQSVEDIRERVSKAAQFMLNGSDVLSGAKAAGIVNIYPKRYAAIGRESGIDAIKRDILVESDEIRIMGISLGDYFLDRGGLKEALLEVLQTEEDLGPKVRALIVHPNSHTLRERARWEAGQEFYEGDTFFESTTYIETNGAAHIAKRLCERYAGRLEARLYDQAPTAFVLLTSRYAFIEPYSYADRGSNVPVLQVQAGVSSYKHYESHFERIWNVSRPICDLRPTRADSAWMSVHRETG